jgi:hypothetical protein
MTIDIDMNHDYPSEVPLEFLLTSKLLLEMSNSITVEYEGFPNAVYVYKDRNGKEGVWRDK